MNLINIGTESISYSRKINKKKVTWSNNFVSLFWHFSEKEKSCDRQENKGRNRKEMLMKTTGDKSWIEMRKKYKVGQVFAKISN